MSKQEYKVSYANGKIELNVGSRTIVFPINNFYKNNTEQINNDGYETFITNQQYLRALDMMKDGDSKKITKKINSIFYPNNTTISLTKDILNGIENAFTTKFKQQITKKEWTRVSKDSKLNSPLEFEYIFYDVGLSPMYYINYPTYVLNFANEIIDPGNRDFGKKKIDFPLDNGILNIEKSFLDLFGFIGCNYIKATKSAGKYDYEINLVGSASIINDDQYFVGNDKKNSIINDLIDSETKKDNSETKKDNREIKKFLVCKELGDTLQVLIMLLWKMTNPNISAYSMVTNDNVVLLMCMILNLNCIRHVVNKNNKDKQGYRLRTIEVFEVDLDTVENKIKRFKKIKKEIMDDNNDFMKIFDALILKPDTPILLQGVPHKFPRIFFQNIKNDIQRINGLLNEYEIIDFNDFIKEIKKMRAYFTINKFLYKNKGLKDLHITQRRFYTENTEKWVDNPNINYKLKIAFHNYVPIQRINRGGGISNESIMDIDQIDIGSIADTNDKIFETLEFEDKKYIVKDENNNEIDLLEVLKQDIWDNLKKLNIIKKNEILDEKNDTFNNYYRELLFQFYLIGEVVYDEEQQVMIQKIRFEFESTNEDIRSTSNLDVDNQLKMEVDNNAHKSVILVSFIEFLRKNVPSMFSKRNQTNKKHTNKQKISQKEIEKQWKLFKKSKNIKNSELSFNQIGVHRGGGNKTRKLKKNKHKRHRHNKTSKK